ncbi:MAG: alpha/beta hydrolase [Acidobacteria bacterium]|nr:alpha/beta hydrolase [Acidobacteriota bacterium]
MRVKKSIVLFIILAAIVAAAIAQTQKPTDSWAKFDNVKIRYYDIGNKKAKNALVLVHCWTCNVEFWKDSLYAFPNYRVIAMDLPGHGQSDKPRVDYSMEYFARAVDAVMKKAKVDKAVLVGHSMGTPIIRKYYELYPNKTLGLVLVDGALLSFGPKDEVEKFFQPLLADYKNGAPKFIDGMLEPTQAQIKPFIRSTMLATPDYVGASAMRLMLDDSFASHGKIGVPVLATMAPSPYWPKDIEQQYKAIAPTIDFQAWTGVSHFLHMEKPKEFNDAVSAFIAKNKLL